MENILKMGDQFIKFKNLFLYPTKISLDLGLVLLFKPNAENPSGFRLISIVCLLCKLDVYLYSNLKTCFRIFPLST